MQHPKSALAHCMDVRQQNAHMRFSLIDMVIWVGCPAFGFIAVIGIAHWLGYGRLSVSHLLVLGYLLGVIFFFVFTPPIYRWLRLLPLFLPRCPHCKKLPGAYRIKDTRWPRQVVACSLCQKPIELWWRRPALADVSKTMPSLLLSWPESIGRWRLVSRGEVIDA